MLCDLLPRLKVGLRLLLTSNSRLCIGSMYLIQQSLMSAGFPNVAQKGATKTTSNHSIPITYLQDSVL